MNRYLLVPEDGDHEVVEAENLVEAVSQSNDTLEAVEKIGDEVGQPHMTLHVGSAADAEDPDDSIHVNVAFHRQVSGASLLAELKQVIRGSMELAVKAAGAETDRDQQKVMAYILDLDAGDKEQGEDADAAADPGE